MSAGRIRSFAPWFVYFFLLCLVNRSAGQTPATGTQQTLPPGCEHNAHQMKCLPTVQPSQAPATPAAAQQNIYHCRFGSQKGNHVTYYSSGWIHTGQAADLTALEAAWTKYIRATYDVTNLDERGICDGVQTHDDEQTWINNWERGTATQTRFASVVHVNWTYTPQNAVATASSQPAATTTAAQPVAVPATAPAASTIQQHRTPAPQPAAAASTPTQMAPVQSRALDESPTSVKVHGFHCMFTTHQGTHAVRYSSSLVQGDVTLATLNPAWQEYVRSTYHITPEMHGHGQCQPMNGNPTNLQKGINAVDEGAQRSGVEIVHVTWASAPGSN
jgi:hypothetical protein